MDLENNKLSERNQSQKTTYYIIPFIRKSTIGKSIYREKADVCLFRAEGRER